MHRRIILLPILLRFYFFYLQLGLVQKLLSWEWLNHLVNNSIEQFILLLMLFFFFAFLVQLCSFVCRDDDLHWFNDLHRTCLNLAAVL